MIIILTIMELREITRIVKLRRIKSSLEKVRNTMKVGAILDKSNYLQI